MSHNIDINFDIHNGLEQAWHGLAKVKPESELRTFAGGALDYTIEESDIFTPDKEKIEGFKRLQAIRPNGTKGFYDVVNESYSVIQNSAVFESLMTAIDGVKGKVSYLGSIESGARCFATFEPESNQWVDSEGRKHETKLNIVWGHDNKTTVSALVSDVRVVCANTLALATLTGSKLFKIRHTKNASLKLEGFENAIAQLFTAAQDYSAQIERLGNQTVNAVDLTAFVYSQTVNKDKDGKLATRGLNHANEIIDLFYNGRGNIGQNKSDVLNAFTEFYTHGSKASKREAGDIWQSSEFGAYANNKKGIFSILCDNSAYMDALTVGRELVKLA